MAKILNNFVELRKAQLMQEEQDEDIGQANTKDIQVVRYAGMIKTLQHYNLII